MSSCSSPFSRALPSPPLLLALLLLLASRSPAQAVQAGAGSDVPHAQAFTVSQRPSSDQITCFAEDGRGYIWIGTMHGLNRYNGQSYCQLALPIDSTDWDSDFIIELKSDNQGGLWISTVNCLFRLSYEDGLTRVHNEPVMTLADTSGSDIILGNFDGVWRADKTTLEVHPIHTFRQISYSNLFLVDRAERLWVFEQGLIQCILPASGEVIATLTPDSEVHHAILLGDIIYMAMSDGFAAIDAAQLTWLPRGQLSALSQPFSREMVYKLFPHDDHSFFIVTRQRGLYLYDTANHRLLASGHPDFPFAAPETELTSIFVDSQQNIWIGTRRQGYQVAYRRQKPFGLNHWLTSFFQGYYISSLHVSDRGELWVVADNRLLYRCDTAGNIHPVSCRLEGTIDQVWTDPTGRIWLTETNNVYRGRLVEGNRIAIDEVYPLMPLTGVADATGQVYVGSADGHAYYLAVGGTAFDTIPSPTTGLYFSKFLPLPSGQIAILDMIQGILIFEPVTSRLTRIDVSARLGHDVKLADAAVDGFSCLWLATKGDGVLSLDLHSNELRQYCSDAFCTDACSVVPDGQGRVWVGTQNGLALLEPATGRMARYGDRDGLVVREFAPCCAALLPHAQVLLGGVGGLVSIAPEEAASPPDTTRLLMEYLAVDGHIVQDLTLHPSVVLKYDDVGIDLSFSTLSYGCTPPALEYRLEGLSSAWTSQLGGEGHAHYSQLPPGRYTFRVRTTDTEDHAVEQTVEIRVRPPWWLTPLMRWLAYPIAFVLLVAGVVWACLRRQRGRLRMAAMMQEREQERQANEMNMRFFSNISHEFRTPLTLIHGALSMMVGNPSEQLQGIARRNTDRMLRLVNQLMDFNKMENGMLRLHVGPEDPIALLRGWAGLFDANLRRHEMPLTLSLPTEPVTAWVDRDKLEKVMMNLLSNAIKYSHKGDELRISAAAVSGSMEASQASTHGRNLVIEVADTGIGIPESEREAIFQRFYQIERRGRVPALGTGVGLYYVRSLVELHHGRISCRPNLPRGSVFTVILPIDESAYTEEEKRPPSPMQADEIELPQPSQERQNEVTAEPTPMANTQIPKSADDDDSPLLMVVDDDSDVLQFLQLLLSPHYRLAAYTSASTAYAELESVRPDLIVSDVIMEGMDGYTFCREVRANATVCHIPVILLTARSAVSEQIEGLDCGASAYITKPFAPDYLLAVVRSQLEAMRRLQQSLNSGTHLPQPTEQAAPLQEADKAFMQSIYAYIEAHLSDVEIDMDQLTGKLGMSRRKFFYKVKALTGDTPGAFFKTYKLNRAAEMILAGDDKLSYIADLTGFSSPSHFSITFKKQFGCAPSEYKALHADGLRGDS